MKDLIIKTCKKCGAVVVVCRECDCDNCGIRCCGEQMERIVPNSVECSIEKHKPIYEVAENYIIAKVPHVMENEHYIEWMAIVSDKVQGRKTFVAGEEAKAIFPYVKGSKIYAYCNKHGLWETIVE